MCLSCRDISAERLLMETTPAECSVLFAGSTDRDDRSKMSRVAASPTDMTEFVYWIRQSCILNALLDLYIFAQRLNLHIPCTLSSCELFYCKVGYQSSSTVGFLLWLHRTSWLWAVCYVWDTCKGTIAYPYLIRINNGPWFAKTTISRKGKTTISRKGVRRCENCEILTGEGSSGKTSEASRGGKWGGVFPPVNIAIANPKVQKESLIEGSKNNCGLNPQFPTILTLVLGTQTKPIMFKLWRQQNGLLYNRLIHVIIHVWQVTDQTVILKI